MDTCNKCRTPEIGDKFTITFTVKHSNNWVNAQGEGISSSNEFAKADFETGKIKLVKALKPIAVGDRVAVGYIKGEVLAIFGQKAWLLADGDASPWTYLTKELERVCD